MSDPSREGRKWIVEQLWHIQNLPKTLGTYHDEWRACGLYSSRKSATKVRNDIAKRFAFVRVREVADAE